MKTLENLISKLSKPLTLEICFFAILGVFVVYNIILVIKHFRSWRVPEKFVGQKWYQNIFYYIKRTGWGFLHHKIIFNLLLVGFVGLVLAGFYLPLPHVISPSDPSLGITEISDKNPLIVKFDRRVDRENLKYDLFPAIEGDWEFTSGVIGSDLKFVPKKTPEAETRYTISLKGIKNIFGNASENYLFSFQTPPAPKIVSVSPGDGDQGVLPNQEILVTTDFPHLYTAKFNFDIEPPVELDVKNLDDVKYSLKAKDTFKKGTEYSLKISRTKTTYSYETKKTENLGEKEELWAGKFKIIEAPGIKSYAPSGYGVLIDTSIKIEFRQDMNQEETVKAFSVGPKIDGDISWESPRMLVFKPKSPLGKNTKYTVGISVAAKAADDSNFEEAFSYSFTTIGYVVVSGFYPGNGARSVDLNSRINVTFNQAVDHESAQSKFGISPTVGGNFSWNGNTMVFTPSGFGYSQGYTINIASGVKTVNGLDSVQAFSSGFTTRQQVVMLNIPSWRQTHMYTCMAAASREALAYRGITVSELHIVDLMGYDYTPWSGTWRDPNAAWGDPNAGYVGDIDGHSAPGWGYGSHWDPVVKAISSYRPVELKRNWSVQGIARELANGNPVIVWWVNGVWPAYELYWKNNGKSIRAVNSLHVQVVKGFTGTVDNPTSFTVNDSGYGYPARTYDVGTFQAKWGWFSNTGIIVR
ncbi:hypothetical protein AUK11_02230 [bacterium CG2_30_37_16]|nr:MAG: hypothetical protein AUK11_02230 [bacterium CG2_30_37_16]